VAKGSVFENDLGTKVQSNRRHDGEEMRLIAALEQKRYLEKYEKDLEKLGQGTLDLPAFLRQLAPQMIKNLLITSEKTESDKLKVDIAQDLLDRAGYGKVQKHAHMHGGLDPKATRREIMSMIRSKARKANITINGKVNEKLKDDVIDATIARSGMSVSEDPAGSDCDTDEIFSEGEESTPPDSSGEGGDV